VLPEFILAAMASSVLGWGALTWRKSEQAKEAAEQALHKIERVELKVAEDYLSKKEFEGNMDRLFEDLKEMKADMKYISQRVDFHIEDQALTVKQLREQLSKRRWL
jgi:hypothetical protein